MEERSLWDFIMLIDEEQSFEIEYDDGVVEFYDNNYDFFECKCMYFLSSLHLCNYWADHDIVHFVVDEPYSFSSFVGV